MRKTQPMRVAADDADAGAASSALAPRFGFSAPHGLPGARRFRRLTALGVSALSAAKTWAECGGEIWGRARLPFAAFRPDYRHLY